MLIDVTTVLELKQGTKVAGKVRPEFSYFHFLSTGLRHPLLARTTHIHL